MIVFTCDAPGCDDRTTGYVDYEMQRAYDDAGWLSDGDEDYCRVHAPSSGWSWRYHPDESDAPDDIRLARQAAREKEQRDFVEQELKRRRDWDASYPERLAMWQAHLASTESQ